IQKQSGYNILYDSSLIPATLLVDINVTNQNLNSTLNAVLDKHNLGYKIMDKNIILNHKKVIASAPTTQTTPGQQQTVTGKVLNEKSEILGSVTIREKGTQNSTMTDDFGNFTIEVTSSNPV